MSDVMSGTSDHGGGPAPAAGTDSAHTLRSGALKIGDVVIMALASSGPTQSIAVTLAVGTVGKALADIVSTLGLMAAIFYLLTASTAVWYYRKTIMASTANFVLGGVLPGFGAAFMAFVIIYILVTHALNGVELAFGFGLALVGLALSFVAKAVTGSAFYSDRSARGGITS